MRRPGTHVATPHVLYSTCTEAENLVAVIDHRRRMGQREREEMSLPAFLALLKASSHNFKATAPSRKISPALTDILGFFCQLRLRRRSEKKDTLIWLCQTRRGKETMGGAC